MTADQFKAWLEGYMAGAGNAADAQVIAKKAQELVAWPVLNAGPAVARLPIYDPTQCLTGTTGHQGHAAPFGGAS